MSRKLEDEIDCLINIVECLTTSLKKITLQSELRNQDYKVQAYPTLQQTIECFRHSITLLAADPDPIRIRFIVFENCAEFIPTLFGFVAIPVPRYLTNKQAIQGFTKVRVEAMKTLTRFISLCGYDDDAFRKEDRKLLGKFCCEAIVENQGLEALLNMLQADEYESVRRSISEFLFVFCSKNEFGKLALSLEKGIPTLLECLVSEPAAKVRNFICAIVREFCGSFPDELLKENILEIASRLINIDPSKEVKALCAEILELLLKEDERAISLLRDDSNLPQILSQRLMHEDNMEVIEGCCKLLETLFCSKKSAFIDQFIYIGGWTSFINILKKGDIRPASLAIRAFRYLLQNSDFRHCLGYKVITHFPSLSVLLKAVLKQEKQPDVDIAQKLLKVELAICLGIMFTGNPNCRQHVFKELKSFPLWMGTLRAALLKHLGLAELEYFSDISLVDASGVDLMKDFYQEYNEGPAIKNVFLRQEKRFLGEGGESFTHGNHSKIEDLAMEIHTEEQLGKIKSFILIFSIHKTLSPPPRDPPKSVQLNSQYSMQPQISSYQAQSEYQESQTKSQATRSQFSEKSIHPFETKPELSLESPSHKMQSPRSAKKRKTPRKGPTEEEIRIQNGLPLVYRYAKYYAVNDQVASPYQKLFQKYHNLQQKEKSQSQLRFNTVTSPRKFQKSWELEYVQLSDLFFFDIYLEDFTMDAWLHLLKKCKKHHKLVKKRFVTCPTSRNGKGRRTFLLDMKKNIIPAIYQLIEEFTMLIDHHGVEQIRITVYLWRGNDRSISSVNQNNIQDCLSFVKDHLAKSQHYPEKRVIENEYLDKLDEALNESEEPELEKPNDQDDIFRKNHELISDAERQLQELENHVQQLEMEADDSSSETDENPDLKKLNTTLEEYGKVNPSENVEWEVIHADKEREEGEKKLKALEEQLKQVQNFAEENLRLKKEKEEALEKQKKAELEREKALQDREQAIQEKERAEKVRLQKAEEEKQKAEEEKQKAEEEKQKAEQLRDQEREKEKLARANQKKAAKKKKRKDRKKREKEAEQKQNDTSNGKKAEETRDQKDNQIREQKEKEAREQKEKQLREQQLREQKEKEAREQKEKEAREQKEKEAREQQIHEQQLQEKKEKEAKENQAEKKEKQEIEAKQDRKDEQVDQNHDQTNEDDSSNADKSSSKPQMSLRDRLAARKIQSEAIPVSPSTEPSNPSASSKEETKKPSKERESETKPISNDTTEDSPSKETPETQSEISTDSARKARRERIRQRLKSRKNR